MNLKEIVQKNVTDVTSLELQYLLDWSRQELRIPGYCGKLQGMRCYLSGAMTYVDDSGTSWRTALGMFLKELGVKIIDPTDKPIDFGREDIEDAIAIKKEMARGDFDALTTRRAIRATDLRSVDISDFIILSVDLEHYTVGTWEEGVLGNRQKKPIIVHVEQGKRACPPWLFWMIPHQMIFSEWFEVMDYLKEVDKGKLHDYDRKRWMFFNL
jgi:hypothetical protein